MARIERTRVDYAGAGAGRRVLQKRVRSQGAATRQRQRVSDRRLYPRRGPLRPRVGLRRIWARTAPTSPASIISASSNNLAEAGRRLEAAHGRRLVTRKEVSDEEMRDGVHGNFEQKWSGPDGVVIDVSHTGWEGTHGQIKSSRKAFEKNRPAKAGTHFSGAGRLNRGSRLSPGLRDIDGRTRHGRQLHDLRRDDRRRAVAQPRWRRQLATGARRAAWRKPGLRPDGTSDGAAHRLCRCGGRYLQEPRRRTRVLPGSTRR